MEHYERIIHTESVEMNIEVEEEERTPEVGKVHDLPYQEVGSIWQKQVRRVL